MIMPLHVFFEIPAMASDVEEIKKRIDIVDYLGAFITLKKAGRNYKPLCPFHNEKTPSFIVSPDRQTWHCFGGCQEGGDAIKFLMKWENMTFFEALKELAEKTGVKLQKLDFEDKIWKKKERLFAINSLAEEFFHFLLTKHKIGEEARQYLSKRNISSKVIETFKLGYSPSSWESLSKFLIKKNYQSLDLIESGLVVQTETNRTYDRFRHRLIFPLKDPRGNTLGFSGRLFTDEKEAKYVNTPETPVYHKRETLFGLNITKENVKKKEQVIVVEGEFDMLTCFQNGISNVVAVKGSAVTRDQLMLLKRYTNKMILALDADSAGEETTKRAISDAEALDFEIYVADYNYAKDPDEAITTDLARFKKIIDEPVVYYDFIISRAFNKYHAGDAFSKKNIATEVVNYLVDIQNPIVKIYYIKKLSSMIDLDDKTIENLMNKEIIKRKKKNLTKVIVNKAVEINRFELLQRYVLSVLFQNSDPKKTIKQILKIVQPENFSIPSYQKLLERFGNFIEKRESMDFNIKQFIQTLSSELIPVFDEIYLFDIAIFDKTIEEIDLNKTLMEIKKLALKKQIKEKITNIGDNDEEDKHSVNQLVEQLSSLEKKISMV